MRSMRVRSAVFAMAALAALIGCSAPVTIHRDSSTVRVTSCDPNRRFAIETEGETPAATRERADAAIRKQIRALRACDALVTNGSLGKTRFGFREVDMVEPCSCSNP